MVMKGRGAKRGSIAARLAAAGFPPFYQALSAPRERSFSHPRDRPAGRLQAPPSREGFAGTIVTGSGAMVTDRHEWSERSAQWLRDAAHDGMPLLGICYGHQLIAHALGGEVDYHPAGREMGTVQLELHPQA